MARPIYETQRDREQQRVVLLKMARALGYTARETTPLMPQDGYLYSAVGRAVMVVEVKCRRCAWRQYPTLMISARKVESLLQRASAGSVVPAIAVQYDDGLVVYPVSREALAKQRRGGRVDRQDTLDMEWVVDIPTSSGEYLCP